MSNKYITKVSMKQNFEECKINKATAIELIDPEGNSTLFTINMLEEVDLRGYVSAPRETIYYERENEFPW